MRRHTNGFNILLVALTLAVITLLYLSCSSSSDDTIAKSMGGQAISDIIFSPDGDRIAYVEVPKWILFGAEVFTQMSEKPEGESWLVVKPLDGEPKKVCKLGDGSKTAQAQWRPGSEDIILNGYDLLDEGHTREGIYIASVTGGTIKTLIDGKDGWVSPDGRRLAFVRTQYTSGRGEEGLYILELDTGRDYKISDLKCKHPRWCPATGELTFCGVLASERDRSNYRKSRRLKWYYGDVYVWDPASPRVRQVTADGWFEDPVFTPDGEHILATSMDVVPDTRNKSLVKIDKFTGKWEILIKADQEAYHDYIWIDFMPGSGDLIFEGRFKNTELRSASGRKSLRAQEDRNPKDLFRIALDGTGLQRLELGHEFKQRPVFTPDGSMLTYRVEYADYNTEFFSVAATGLN